jgi:hypothetical protein
VSADWEKFQDEINLIWLKGNEILFERSGTEFYTNCKLTTKS